MSHGEPAPLILHCAGCDRFRSHHTVEGRDYGDTCDRQHPAPFTFGALTPLQVSSCSLLRDEYERGILTEYPWRVR